MNLRCLLLAVFAALASGACAGAVRSERRVDQGVAEAMAAAQVSLDDSARATAALRRLVGDRRFVLLGENGHGVGSHTSLKVLLTRLLVDSLGFTVVAFESGYHECDVADRTLPAASAVATLRDCFAYAFEHAEALPLIEHLRTARRAGRDLRIAGVDYQPQGSASLTRPNLLRRAISHNDSVLAELVARTDSALLVASQLGGDSLRAWIEDEGADADAVFARGMIAADAATRWHLRAAIGLLERGRLRFSNRDSIPAAYYAARDRFMANSISWIADSVGSARKVVVWMHNDHVRYGMLNTPSGKVRATGGLLAEQYREDVVSIGFFMGAGEVTNNSRALRSVLPIEAGSLESELERSGLERSLLPLRASSARSLRGWTLQSHAYLRNGLERDSLTPIREFDALVYALRATPPTYRLPAP